MKVGLKFCGHCNPWLESREIIQALEKKLDEDSFVPWDDPEKEVLLILSGCPVDCADCPQFAGPIVRFFSAPFTERDTAALKVKSALEKIRDQLGER